MDKGRRAVYPKHMPDVAGERLIEVAGLPVARGVDPPLIRDGLCFIAQMVGGRLEPKANADVRRKLESALNALARYAQKEAELVSLGFPVPERQDQWLEASIGEISKWLDQPKSPDKRPELRTELYPYLLALFQLSFGKHPTAYYDHGKGQDGSTLAFIRQAAREIDDAYGDLIKPLGKEAARRFGDGQSGTLSTALPSGDSLRIAIEGFLPSKVEGRDWDRQDSKSDEAIYEDQFLFALEALQLVIFPRIAP